MTPPSFKFFLGRTSFRRSIDNKQALRIFLTPSKLLLQFLYPKEMGVWDYFSSATETVKQYTPDLTPVKTICGHGWSAVTKVDNAVRVVAVGKLSHYWRDEQARSDMTRFAADFAKNTGVYVIEEGAKTVPGGAPVYKIFSKSLKSGGEKKGDDKKMKELSARIEKLEKQILDSSSSSKLHEQTEIPNPDLGLKSSKTIRRCYQSFHDEGIHWYAFSG